jgi:hypothetical protein
MALAVIMSLYVGIGALAAVGSMYLSHRFVSARFEAGLYGLFLIPIAAFYLVFASYFGDAAAWKRPQCLHSLSWVALAPDCLWC